MKEKRMLHFVSVADFPSCTACSVLNLCGQNRSPVYLFWGALDRRCKYIHWLERSGNRSAAGSEWRRNADASSKVFCNVCCPKSSWAPGFHWRVFGCSPRTLVGFHISDIVPQPGMLVCTQSSTVGDSMHRAGSEINCTHTKKKKVESTLLLSYTLSCSLKVHV